jgi:hypothetical protein
VKKKLFIVSIIPFIITACTANFLTDNISSASSTQSENTTDRANSIGGNDCRLIVNGKDITAGNYVVLNQEDAELPFTAIMKELGAKIDWKNKTQGLMFFNHKIYILDTENCSLLDKEKGWDCLLTPPGGFHPHKLVGVELIIGSARLNTAFQLMDTEWIVNIDYDKKVITIE